MKKLLFIAAFVLSCATMPSFANVINTDIANEITIVNTIDTENSSFTAIVDKDKCPKDCTKACCKDEQKKCDDAAKKECTKKSKAECKEVSKKKAAKKDCCTEKKK